MITEIPKSEFQERARRVQAELAKRGLDALLTFGNEAEPAFVRYLCDYWPAFETAGVLVPVEGDPLLLIGPESLAYAESRSKIDNIRQILEYRESAEPEYPGKALDTFASVFDEVSGGKGVKRLGIVGYPVTTVPVYEGVRQAMAGGEIVRADDILVELRKVKSENELALLRQAFRISEQAMEAVLNNIKPGMAEVQVVGIAQEAIYRLGAEYEGHPLYVLSGRNSANAIGRPTHKKLEKGEIIQLNIGARVGGYSSSVGRPIVLGHISDELRGFLQVGLTPCDDGLQGMFALFSRDGPAIRPLAELHRPLQALVDLRRHGLDHLLVIHDVFQGEMRNYTRFPAGFHAGRPRAGGLQQRLGTPIIRVSGTFTGAAG